MKIRRLVSFTTFVSFVCLAYTGLMLFFSPQGRIAHWSGWRMFGLEREQYSEIHTTFMALFLVAGIWHIVLNWKLIVNYLRDRTRKVKLTTPELGVAVVLGVVFFGGTLWGIFPFHQFLSMGAGIKSYWERVEGSPPWGHAELNSLDRFCRGMEDFVRLEEQRLVSIDCSDAVAALREAGVEVDSMKQVLLDIAHSNGTTPQALAEIIVSVANPRSATDGGAGSVEPSGPFLKPYSGLGRLTLREYAEQYEEDLNQILEILAGAGFDLDPDERLRDEATRLGTDPEGFIEVLNAWAVEQGESGRNR